MKRLSLVLLVLVLLVPALVVGVGAVLPTAARVERARGVAAGEADLRPWLEDLRTWPRWSPWNAARARGDHPEPGADPDLGADDPELFTFEGEPGVGQRWHWNSDGDLGRGTLELLAAEEHRWVYALSADGGEVGPPSRLTVTTTPGSDGTEVRWCFEGDFDGVLMRWLLVTGQYQAWLGSDLELGLAGLARVAEQGRGVPSGVDGVGPVPAAPSTGSEGPEGPAGSSGNGRQGG